MVLREQGVPARLATGYAGGKVLGNKSYLTGDFAHAWTEFYEPRAGWVAIDATPSTILDKKTGEKMDKDRFRRDLGGVMEAYQEVLGRIKANG